MARSQFSLNSHLPNFFFYVDWQKNGDFNNKELISSLKQAFENQNVIVIDGLKADNLDFFLKHPCASFSDWVPPVMARQIQQNSIDENHPLWKFFPSDAQIREFQKQSRIFQSSWSTIQTHLFPSYQANEEIWSWRFNKMDLGYLHLDIAPTTNDHQMRTFINLSARPRIIEIGPTLEQLAKKFYDRARLYEFEELNDSAYLSAIKQRLFKELNLEHFYLPRHSLRLAPGAAWICHSSLIIHGLIYGEKTVCCEWRIPVSHLGCSALSFQRKMENIKAGHFSEIEDFQFDGDPMPTIV